MSELEKYIREKEFNDRRLKAYKAEKTRSKNRELRIKEIQEEIKRLEAEAEAVAD